MTQITVYRTYSYGGVDGREVEKKTFETIKLAKENAKNDTWNSGFKMYEVVITFDGIVTEKETFIEEIICGRDIEALAYEKENIKRAENAIEEHKANTEIKEKTRKKKIAEEKKRITWSKERIERIIKKG